MITKMNSIPRIQTGPYLIQLNVIMSCTYNPMVQIYLSYLLEGNGGIVTLPLHGLPPREKVADLNVTLMNEIAGTDLDYCCLPAVGLSGGLLVDWRRDLWSGTMSFVRQYSVTVRAQPLIGEELKHHGG
jgi:hypothetical protein